MEKREASKKRGRPSNPLGTHSFNHEMRFDLFLQVRSGVEAISCNINENQVFLYCQERNIGQWKNEFIYFIFCIVEVSTVDNLQSLVYTLPSPVKDTSKYEFKNGYLNLIFQKKTLVKWDQTYFDKQTIALQHGVHNPLITMPQNHVSSSAASSSVATVPPNIVTTTTISAPIGSTSNNISGCATSDPNQLANGGFQSYMQHSSSLASSSVATVPPNIVTTTTISAPIGSTVNNISGCASSDPNQLANGGFQSYMQPSSSLASSSVATVPPNIVTTTTISAPIGSTVNNISGCATSDPNQLSNASNEMLTNMVGSPPLSEESISLIDLYPTYNYNLLFEQENK